MQQFPYIRAKASGYAKTREQIAQEYGISRKTLYNWLRREGLQFSQTLLGPRQVARIYAQFGEPPVAEQTPEQ